MDGKQLLYITEEIKDDIKEGHYIDLCNLAKRAYNARQVPKRPMADQLHVIDVDTRIVDLLDFEACKCEDTIEKIYVSISELGRKRLHCNEKIEALSELNTFSLDKTFMQNELDAIESIGEKEVKRLYKEHLVYLRNLLKEYHEKCIAYQRKRLQILLERQTLFNQV